MDTGESYLSLLKFQLLPLSWGGHLLSLYTTPPPHSLELFPVRERRDFPYISPSKLPHWGNRVIRRVFSSREWRQFPSGKVHFHHDPPPWHSFKHMCCTCVGVVTRYTTMLGNHRCAASTTGRVRRNGNLGGLRMRCSPLERCLWTTIPVQWTGWLVWLRCQRQRHGPTETLWRDVRSGSSLERVSLAKCCWFVCLGRLFVVLVAA